jgi:inosine-uridine nucleoside N-ribohydrolase
MAMVALFGVLLACTTGFLATPGTPSAAGVASVLPTTTPTVSPEPRTASSTPSRALAAPSATRRAVLVDTDVSIDDLMAMLYLLGRPDIDVKGITTVHGVAHLEQGTQLVLRLLTSVGRTDVPVAAGASAPMHCDHAIPEQWRRNADAGWGLDLPPAGATASPMSGAQMIRELANAFPGEITVLAIGPLTNVALALREDPALATRLNQIVVGDGAILVAGNVHAEYPAIPNRVAAWNLYLDPESADIVFRSGASLVLDPLDVTYPTSPHPIVLTREMADRYRPNAVDPSSRMLRFLMATWLDTFGHGKPVPDWDLVTAAIYVDPSVCADWRELAIVVDTGPDETAGQTRVSTGDPANTRACLAGDQAAFDAVLLGDDR